MPALVRPRPGRPCGTFLASMAVHLGVAGIGEPQLDPLGGQRLERLLEALQIAGVRDDDVHAVAECPGQRDDWSTYWGYSFANVAQPSITSTTSPPATGTGSRLVAPNFRRRTSSMSSPVLAKIASRSATIPCTDAMTRPTPSRSSAEPAPRRAEVHRRRRGSGRPPQRSRTAPVSGRYISAAVVIIVSSVVVTPDCGAPITRAVGRQQVQRVHILAVLAGPVLDADRERQARAVLP